jgi:hypothetical protein
MGVKSVVDEFIGRTVTDMHPICHFIATVFPVVEKQRTDLFVVPLVVVVVVEGRPDRSSSDTCSAMFQLVAPLVLASLRQNTHHTSSLQ